MLICSKYLLNLAKLALWRCLRALDMTPLFDILVWMEVTVIIPARYASSRLPGKPLELIGSKPMVQCVYERASKASLVGDVIVATDDERIEAAVKDFGGSVVMTSTKHLSGTDRIAEAIGKARVKSELIVNVQGDEPLIEPSVIDCAIKPVLDAARGSRPIDICTLKTLVDDRSELDDPNVVKVVTDKDDFALYFSRSAIPYDNLGDDAYSAYKHVGLYVYKREFIELFSKLKPSPLEVSEKLEQLRALENGYNIKVVLTDNGPISVDTPEDLKRVRDLVEKQ